MNIEALKTQAHAIHGNVLCACRFNYDGRADLAARLAKAGRDAGLEGAELRFVVSYGLAQSGYGGGW